jgi:hypothetical protein
MSEQESIFTVIGRTTKQLVGERLPLTGGTLTGSLILYANPTAPLGAATKNYVDTELASLTQYARLDGADFTGDVTGTNLTLSGDLTVNGAVTTLNTTNSTISDSLILLSKGASDNANATSDAGIMIERGSGEDNAAMYWDEGQDSFRMTTTSSDATASDLGGTSVSANLEVAGLKTNGNDLGKLEDFLGGCITSTGTATILKTEYDAVATSGVVEITGITSPFQSTTITTTYSTPAEIVYQLNEVSHDGTDTTVRVTILQVSNDAYDHLTASGNITIGGSAITFK